MSHSVACEALSEEETSLVTSSRCSEDNKQRKELLFFQNMLSYFLKTAQNSNVFLEVEGLVCS